MTPRETIEIQKEMIGTGRSKADKYRALVIGQPGAWALIKYELVMLLACNLPGALGLYLRAKLYPRLLKACGRNVNFGMGVVIRHPHKIEIGDDVVIDDHCLLDAKGTSNQGIRIGNGVFLGRNSILSCKNGDITLGNGVNIGFNCEVFSASSVQLGANTLVAAYTYFVGGDHDATRTDISVAQQGRSSKGIQVGEGAWFGAGVCVLDGVSIGGHSIIGAGAVVRNDVADYQIAVGIPARVVRDRRERPAGAGPA